MASCPRNDKLTEALKTPELMELRNKLDEIMKQVPCSRDGQSMRGGAPDMATMAKIGTICVSIAVALQSVLDVSSAMSAQCSSFQLTAGLIAGSGYCNAQTALLATTVTYSIAKVAAAGTAIYAANSASTGGKRRTRRRKVGRKKSSKKKSNKKRKKRTHKRR